MSLNFQQTRELLYNFQFQDLFIEQFGWLQPTQINSSVLEIERQKYESKRIAEISEVAVFEIKAPNGEIPTEKVRAAIHNEISNLVANNLLIFVDSKRTCSHWSWIKQENNKKSICEHLYEKGQPGDLFLKKFDSLVFDITEVQKGNFSVADISFRLQKAFDIERVNKKFYKEFKELYKEFLGNVKGIDNQADKRWYTYVILNRLMFVYFLQSKGLIDNGDTKYLQNKLENSKQRGKDKFYQEFLHALFFKSFNKPEIDRDKSVKSLVGKVKYFNCELFCRHRIEQDYDISITDEAFEKVLSLFACYSWNLDDSISDKDDEINSDVLGYIFENTNTNHHQMTFGRYYTVPQISEYLCERTIGTLIVNRVNTALSFPPFSTSGKYKQFVDLKELFFKLDANLCYLLINEDNGILANLSILDPACASGAFLIAALKTLVRVYSALIGKIQLQGDSKTKQWLKGINKKHKSLSYYIKKQIINNNLYGVDIMEEATEITKLRFSLALIASFDDVDELEPLPNNEFNIATGNSLIGLIQVDEKTFKSEEEHLASQYSCLSELKKPVDELKNKSQINLNNLLLDEFINLGIKYEKKQLTGEVKKRLLNTDDIVVLKPFHWGYHFNKIIERGGFDVIITNPPWGIIKPHTEEFFAQHSDLLTKNGIDINTFKKQPKKLLEEKLLQNPEITEAWFKYQSKFSYVIKYFLSSEDYENQTSIIDGKIVYTHISLYKLFLERCFHLLRNEGECGIIIPSSIITDLKTKQLREMLFSQTKVTGLFCLENRKAVFENIDRRFEFVILTFEKNGTTKKLPSAFKQLDVNELESFPSEESFWIDIELLRKLSPDLLPAEFPDEISIRIAEKMLKFPLLGENIMDKWNLRLSHEFHMVNDSHLLHSQPGEGRLPLYEGKMIHQFTYQYEEPRYWVDEKEGRKALLGCKRTDIGQKLDYQNYRLGIRSIASSTNKRSLILSVIPGSVFCSNSLLLLSIHSEDNQVNINNSEILYNAAIFNCFVVDYCLRRKVATILNTSYLCQLPIPRLTEGDNYFTNIVQRAAKLICTTPEFDDLAQVVGLDSHKNGVTDETQRAQLRAELDGIIAHLYGLTEEEFKYILTTFPIVPEETKQAALEAYRTFAPMSGDAEIISLIEQGENDQIEFKSTARWNLRDKKKDKAMEHEIVKTVAAFLNTNGGTLLIGVDDDGVPLGLDNDYQTLKKKNNDGYMLFLNHDLLLREIGKEFGTLFRITFHQVSGQHVCRVIVQPSPKQPIYVKHKDKNGKEEEIFYIRSNNSSVKLSTKQAVEYSRNRWG